MIKDFECIKCGNCCKTLTPSFFTFKEPFSINMFMKHIYDKIERCKYLDENNLCTIYNDRPDICKTYPNTIGFAIKSNCKGNWSEKINRNKNKYVM